MKCKAYLLNWLRHQGGGGTPLSLQDDKAVTITTNGKTTIQPDEGYAGLTSVEVTTNVVGEYNAKIKTNFALDDTSLLYWFEEFDVLNFQNFTAINAMFNWCKNLKKIKGIINTSNITLMPNTFNHCDSLVDLPLFDTSKVTTMQSAFKNCGSLSNDSLNNILHMCANVSADYSRAKTLSDIGLDSTQATTCTTLSNWAACVSAGWTTGY